MYPEVILQTPERPKGLFEKITSLITSAPAKTSE